MEDFSAKFCPRSKTCKLREQITNFEQLENEQLGEAWTRYKELMRKCPGHGLTELLVFEFFYKGLQSESKKQVDMSAGGALMGKDEDVSRELLDKVKYNENQWTLKPVVKI